ncbi:hypothetical protein [Bradyrhizobium sp. URHC0002]
MKLRVCKSRRELIALLLERQDELNISASTIDGIAGVADSYTSKCLSLTPAKNIGPIALGAILGALALKIVKIEIAEDPEAAAAVSGRWTPRKRRPNHRKPARSAQWCSANHNEPEFNFGNTGEPDMANRMIGVRLDPELDERLKIAAEKDRRPVSQFVRNVLSDALAKSEPPTDPKSEVTA